MTVLVTMRYLRPLSANTLFQYRGSNVCYKSFHYKSRVGPQQSLITRSLWWSVGKPRYADYCLSSTLPSSSGVQSSSSLSTNVGEDDEDDVFPKQTISRFSHPAHRLVRAWREVWDKTLEERPASSVGEDEDDYDFLHGPGGKERKKQYDFEKAKLKNQFLSALPEWKRHNLKRKNGGEDKYFYNAFTVAGQMLKGKYVSKNPRPRKPMEPRPPGVGSLRIDSTTHPAFEPARRYVERYAPSKDDILIFEGEDRAALYAAVEQGLPEKLQNQLKMLSTERQRLWFSNQLKKLRPNFAAWKKKSAAKNRLRRLAAYEDEANEEWAASEFAGMDWPQIVDSIMDKNRPELDGDSLRSYTNPSDMKSIHFFYSKPGPVNFGAVVFQDLDGKRLKRKVLEEECILVPVYGPDVNDDKEVPGRNGCFPMLLKCHLQASFLHLPLGKRGWSSVGRSKANLGVCAFVSDSLLPMVRDGELRIGYQKSGGVSVWTPDDVKEENERVGS